MILLDTHVAVWLLLEPDKLSSAATGAIRQSGLVASTPAISCISFYEIGWALHRGRIQSLLSPEAFLRRLLTFVRAIPFNESIAVAAAQLPSNFPGDPMDRIIAATALSEGIPLVTADQRIRRSRAVKTIW
jgi:PIN domain nuclease of toxin-antitoxin system